MREPPISTDTNVVSLERERQRRRRAAEGWAEDLEIRVACLRSDSEPGVAILQVETSDSVIECPLDAAEARALAQHLLAIANASAPAQQQLLAEDP